MKPENQRPVMDIQRPRPASTTPPAEPMAPADNIATQAPTPNPGQVIGQQGLAEELHAPAKPPKEKRPGVIIGIVTAVIIIVLGGGIGGFILWTNSRTAEPETTQTQSENERVNVEDIDATVTEIDQTLNSLNDSADITPSDVSDANLGL